MVSFFSQIAKAGIIFHFLPQAAPENPHREE
jgi:hypothetical protein